MWVTICFDTPGDFVDEKYKLKYNGHKIEILRGSEVRGHELYIETEKNYRDGFEIGCQFLSEISWLNRTPLHILTTGGSGRKTSCNVWGKRFNRFSNSINLDNYEQVASTPDQKLALSLYREGITSNSKFSKYLHLYRIINMKNSNGTSQKRWINNNINKINDVNNRKAQINKSTPNTNFGEYLYETLRCAVTHAAVTSSNATTINPDNFDDHIMISRGNDLIQELAELCINQDFNVPIKKSKD